MQANHHIVETEDVYVAEEAYSRHIYNELIDEVHKQVPEIENYFQALNIVGYSRFTLAQWDTAVIRVCPECIDSRDWLKTLYKYAVIGVPKVGGKGGGSKVEFVHEAKFPNPNFAGDVVVHPALIKQLQLKNGSANDDTPVDFDDEEEKNDDEN